MDTRVALRAATGGMECGESCVENVDRVSRRREEAPKVQTALLGSRDDERRHVVSAASTIQDYEGGRRVFDVISQEEAVEADCSRCSAWGGVPVGSLVRSWAGENLWRRRDATDTVLLHLTRADLGAVAASRLLVEEEEAARDLPCTLWG